MTASFPQSATLPAPFDALADTYDDTFTTSRIGTAQRQQVWQELDRTFVPGQRILEINCGTGVDAMHLAARGVHVWACDSSSRMLDVARRRIGCGKLSREVHLECLTIESIAKLDMAARFEGAFSNFGGLNCVEELGAVARDLAALLRPGSPLVLCVMGRYVAWELFWFTVHGRLGKAFRRLAAQPIEVPLGGQPVRCWYRSVHALRRAFGEHFRLRRWRGVGVAIPPSYLEQYARRFPRAMSALEGVDPLLGRVPMIRGLSDHLLLTFERR